MLSTQKPKWFDEAVRKMIWGLAKGCPQLYDDIRGEMYLAIAELEADSRLYDPALLLASARNDVIDVVFRSSAYNNSYKRLVPHTYLDGLPTMVIETLPQIVVPSVEYETAQRLDLVNLLEVLSATEREIVLLYCCAGYTGRELSEFYHVSRSMISRRYWGAIDKMRKQASELRHKAPVLEL